MMEQIDEALTELLAAQRPSLTGAERVALFLEEKRPVRFSRKDYRRMFPELCTATASRDLRDAVVARRLERAGDGRTAMYTVAS